MMKLVSWLAAIIATFALFWYADNDVQQHIDPYIVGLIGTSFFAVATIMVLFTRNWTARGLGIVSSAYGCAVLYLASLLFHLVPSWRRFAEFATDLARSLLLIGGVLLFVGVVRWINGAFFTDGDVMDYRDGGA